MGGHDRGQNQHESDFTKFRRLDLNRKERKVQPALVAGAVVGAERDDQQKHETVQSHQPGSVLGKEIGIHRGNDKKQKNANKCGTYLHKQVTQRAFGIGGTANDKTAKGSCDQTQQQQNQIRFADGFFHITK